MAGTKKLHEVEARIRVYVKRLSPKAAVAALKSALNRAADDIDAMLFIIDIEATEDKQ